MNGRNGPCECGSGKKFKKCCLDKKPRKSTFEYHFDKTVRVDQIKIDRIAGTMDIMSGGQSIVPARAITQTTYDRPKGDKVVVEAPAELKMDLSGAMYADQYDMIIAVDTNTKQIGAESVSVSCIVTSNAKKESDHLHVEHGPIVGLEFRNISIKPENIVWREAIMGFSLRMRLMKRIALVVDSDLGEMRGYNSRSKPIIDSFYLPGNVSLIYASSERDKGQIFNMLMAEADREARTILDHVARHPDDRRDLKAVTGKPYTHFRRWNFNLGTTPDPDHISAIRPRRS